MTTIEKTVFLDTNVFIDQLQQRAGMKAAENIMTLGKDRKIRICLSTLTVANVSYIMRKTAGKKKMAKVFKEWLKYYVILPDNDMGIYSAVRNDCPDFEDGLQIASAEAEMCDAIITSNVRHFAPYTDIPVYTPEDFLAKLRR